MTDEERRQLIAALRSDTFPLEMNYQAADELERLAGTLQTTLVMYGQQQKRLAAIVQSDAEPVAWQLVPIKPTKEMLKRGDQGQTPEYIWEAMLSAAAGLPRPDASAGLIEAAELLELQARRSGERQARWFDKAAKLLRSSHADSIALADVIEARRSRVADRSGK